MSRYFSSPKAIKPSADWIDDDSPLIPALSVADHEAADTGLVDIHGNAIMRAPNPIGFGRDSEW